MTWETVATFDNAIAAEIAKNLLEGEGLRVMIANEETVAMNWSLSNAVGGIKLLVPAESVARAELLLDHKKPVPTTDEEIADAIASSPEIATKLAGPPEPFDDTPTDREVDKALNATVFALLFPPAQLYTLWRLVRLWNANPPVRARDRWKVRLAYALSLPLWVVVIVPAALLAGHFMKGPEGPGWRNERFVPGFGPVALTIDMPGQYGPEVQERHTVLGPAQIRSFGVGKGEQNFWVTIYTLPKELTPEDPAAALKKFVDHEIRADGYKLISTTPITIDGRAGTEVDLSGGTFGWRNQVVLLDHHFIVIAANVPNAAMKGADVERFFKSAKIQ